MPWTTPGTATAGEVLTASFWNTQVRDNLNDHETRILKAPQLVYANTISASSFTVDNVFTSTYANYQIVMSARGSAAEVLRMRMRVGGIASGAGYYMAGAVISYSAATVSGVSNNNSAYWDARFAHTDTGSATRCLSNIFLGEPAIAANTAITGTFNDSRTGGQSGSFGGFHNVATAYDGFEIYGPTGTLTGSIRVYGLPNS